MTGRRPGVRDHSWVTVAAAEWDAEVAPHHSWGDLQVLYSCSVVIQYFRFEYPQTLATALVRAKATLTIYRCTPVIATTAYPRAEEREIFGGH